MASFPSNALVLGLSLIAVRMAVGEAPPTAFPAGEPSFAGVLSGIDREWHLSFQSSGKVRVVSTGDLAYWGRYRDSESGPQLVLTDGSVIRADLLSIDDKQFVVGDATGRSRGLWDESTLPRHALRAILWQPPAGDAERDRLLLRLMKYGGIEDLVLLRGGDEAAGTLRSAPRAGRFAAPDAPSGGETISLARARGGEALEIPVVKVIAVALASMQLDRAANPPRSAWLGFADGSLVHAHRLTIKGDIVAVSLAAGGQLSTTLAGRANMAADFWKAVTYVEPVNQRVQWLADSDPLGYKHIPFLGVNRSFGTNANVLGTRLRAAKAVVPRGIGMPSASRLAFDVAGHRRFEAEIAVDDAAEWNGSAVFKVLLEKSANEWSAAYESQVMRGGDAPVAISVELAGAARMALIVEFADRGDSCDYANWLHARLTR